MEIKTCEQYVLKQLEKEQEELLLAKKEYEELNNNYRDVVKENNKLREIINQLREVITPNIYIGENSFRENEKYIWFNSFGVYDDGISKVVALLTNEHIKELGISVEENK